jgi:hypothetical protein
METKGWAERKVEEMGEQRGRGTYKDEQIDRWRRHVGRSRECSRGQWK